MSHDINVGDDIYYLENGSLHPDIMHGVVDEVSSDGIRIRKASGNFINSQYTLITSKNLWEILHKGVDYGLSLKQDDGRWYINGLIRSFRRIADAEKMILPMPDSVDRLINHIGCLADEMSRLSQTAIYIDPMILDDKVLQDRLKTIQHRIATQLVLVPADELSKLQAKLGMVAFKEPEDGHDNEE